MADCHTFPATYTDMVHSHEEMRFQLLTFDNPDKQVQVVTVKSGALLGSPRGKAVCEAARKIATEV